MRYLKLMFLILTFMIFSLSLFSKKIDKSHWKKFEDKEIGFQFRYPSGKWQIFSDQKKIESFFIKDYLILKRKQGGKAYLRLHVLPLSKIQNFQKKVKSFKEWFEKSRFYGKNYRGLVFKNLSSSESKIYNAKKGTFVVYESGQKELEKRRINLKFLGTDSYIFVLEISFQRNMNPQYSNKKINIQEDTIKGNQEKTIKAIFKDFRISLQ